MTFATNRMRMRMLISAIAQWWRAWQTKMDHVHCTCVEDGYACCYDEEH